jgi:hypothetical protein
MRTMAPTHRNETARFDLVLRDDRRPNRPPSANRVVWSPRGFSVTIHPHPLRDAVHSDSGHWARLLFDPSVSDPEADDQLTCSGDGRRAAAAFVRDFRRAD